MCHAIDIEKGYIALIIPFISKCDRPLYDSQQYFARIGREIKVFGFIQVITTSRKRNRES